MKKWLFLLRSFIPSWKFFTDVGAELSLEVRFGADESQFGEWVNCLPPIARSLNTLLVNPSANYLHACHNHLNHFNADIGEVDTQNPEKITETTTYKITRNMARFQILQMSLTKAPFQYQFRLVANYMSHLNQEPDQILVSLVHESSS